VDRTRAGAAGSTSVTRAAYDPLLLSVARLDDLTRPSYRPDFAVDSRRIYFTINDRQSDISVVQLIER
jgi:hypothetical protein